MKKISYSISSDNSMSFYYDGENVYLAVVLEKVSENRSGAWTETNVVKTALVNFRGVDVLTHERYIELKKSEESSFRTSYIPAATARGKIFSKISGAYNAMIDKKDKTTPVEYGIVSYNRYYPNYLSDAIAAASRNISFNQNDLRSVNQVLSQLEYKQIRDYLSQQETIKNNNNMIRKRTK